MQDPTYQAKITALSMAHGSALADLLRAHGRSAHADYLDAALHEVFRIISAQVGPSTLAEAMRWVAEELGTVPQLSAPEEPYH